jgi:hypothetical protein
MVESVSLAAGSAIVGTAFALATALLAPHLRARMAIDRFRFGSAVALGLLALSILELPVGSAPLLVVVVTALFAFEPNSAPGVDDTVAAADDDAANEPTASADAVSTTSGAVHATDGGDDRDHDDASADDATGEDATVDDGDEPDAFQVDREPWL